MYEIEIKKMRILQEKGAKKIYGSRAALTAALPFFNEEDSWREQCHALFLDNGNNVIGHFLVGIGDEKNVIFAQKAVCAAAVGCLAAAVILAHNHPSGNPMPSQADIRQTERLKKALDVLDIKLLDHIIIGDNEYYSFSDEVRAEIPSQKVT